MWFETKQKKPDFKKSGFWDTMYSTLLQHYLQKHITQDVRKPVGLDENDDLFQLYTCTNVRNICKNMHLTNKYYIKICLENSCTLRLQNGFE